MTSAPLPGWRELFPLLSSEKIGNDALADPWRLKEETAFWFSRSAWALELIAEWIETDLEGRPPIIWIPDYFCNQSLEPLRTKNVKIEFYPIQADLEPNWQTCRNMAESVKPDLFLLVHFFGHLANGSAAKEFCEEFDSYLVEDGAHALVSDGEIGKYGDFTLFSPYKLFAVPDGGLLLIADAKIGAALDEMFSAKQHLAPSSWRWWIKRFIQKVLPAGLLQIVSMKRGLNFNEDPATHSLDRKKYLSAYSRRLLNSLASKQSANLSTRKKNALKLRAEFKMEKNGTPLFSAEAEGAVPYRFALRFRDSNSATKLFDKLSQQGWPVESWPDLPPEVLAEPGKHSEAIKLRRTVVLLPIHHTIDLDRLVRKLAQKTA